MQHILFAHGGWFMNKYGSLEMWSTQGMEKSHYRARGVFFKHTGHGSGKICSIYLKEMFNWFFRCTFGRYLSREIAQKSALAKCIHSFPNDMVVFVVDFARNYSFKEKNEI